jgi:phosphatidylserine decarboxylase
MIRMAPEGRPFALAGTALTALAAGSAILTVGGPGSREAGLWALSALLALTTGFVVFFFRDPERIPSAGPGALLAPADGLVLHITDLDEPEFIRGPARRISIFLSLFDVHVQRAPLAGRVELRRYLPGQYLAAWRPKANEENEQAWLGIVNGPHKVMVRQIAGLVARRVVTDPEVGDTLTQGERIGLIRFGSRVDVFLPADWELACRKGDRTRGGATVVAWIPGASPGARAAVGASDAQEDLAPAESSGDRS